MKKKNKLFGTDGIRQQVGRFPLDDDSIIKIGQAMGTLAQDSQILIGKDTRESGKHIDKLITAGLSAKSNGCHITSVGDIPTPGLSFITCNSNFDLGIMITASHNPYTDNGIKIFNDDGEKLPEEMETQIENIFFRSQDSRLSHSHPSPIDNTSPEIKKIYRDFLSSHVSGLSSKIKTLKIVIDCANGATYELAPLIFREAGLEPMVIHAEPNGKNINRECGSTYIDSLKKTVIHQNADLGIAFDGDGDRVLFTDGDGRLLDGDYSLFLLSQYFLHSRVHIDFNKIVVGTVMGNLGLEKSLERLGIKYLRTPVGDKYVYREMKRCRSMLGGEQSGHTILRSFQKTGDGILTVLYFLKALDHLEIKPKELFEQLKLYPQLTKNIKIREKKDINHWDELNRMIEVFNTKYGDNSRLLIRYSGTEPKIRLMMESEHLSIINDNIDRFENLIRSTIGE
jgi:phosphoglucosamine mutase